MAPNFYRDRVATGKAALAPMAGFTDAPFRRLCREFGSGWSVTEMVSAKALVRGNQQGIDIGEPYPGEPDLVVQLFANDPDLAAQASAMLYRHYRPAAFDLNMGCPVKKIVNKGCGSDLMNRPLLAADIVRAMRASVPVPISVKMRLGTDTISVHEVAHAVAEAGVSAVAVHGRTAVQKYEGEADWEPIVALAQALRIPVIGSGDVSSLEAFRRYRDLGIGVMIGRGSLGRPWIFRTVCGGSAPSLAEVAQLAYRHAHLNCAWYGEHHGMRTIRGQLARYFSHFDMGAKLRPNLVRLARLEDFALLLENALGLEPSFPEGRLPERRPRIAQTMPRERAIVTRSG